MQIDRRLLWRDRSVSHQKSAFFSVSTPFAEKTEVKVIDRQAALKILDDNPGGIINENYIKVFGNVEIG